MAITKNDCLLLLNEIKNSGIETKELVLALLRVSTVPLEIIKFINEHRQLDLTNFYLKLRKSYNNKKSNLYINIVRDNLKNPEDILTILNSLSLQILLFSKNLENKQIFFRLARLQEIYRCLEHYTETYDLVPCNKLLKLIKADLCVCEFFNGKRTIIN